jgi:hypothetical protein
VFVAVVEVVDGRDVEVHRGLDQPQPERVQVEVGVRLRVTGDGRDVVQAVGRECHVAVLVRVGVRPA